MRAVAVVGAEVMCVVAMPEVTFVCSGVGGGCVRWLGGIGARTVVVGEVIRKLWWCVEVVYEGVCGRAACTAMWRVCVCM